MRVLLANLLAGGERPSDINNLSEEESLVSRWRLGDDMLVDPDLLDFAELIRLRRAQSDFVASHLVAPFFFARRMTSSIRRFSAVERAGRCIWYATRETLLCRCPIIPASRWIAPSGK